MKKIIALLCALMLIFTLAACNNKNDDDKNSDKGPEDLQQTGGENGGGEEVPDNGTPLDVPAPFEAHGGDKGYFYPETDDYIIVMYDSDADLTNSDVADYQGAVTYQLIWFENDELAGQCVKYVFLSEQDAQSFTENKGSYIAVGNVAYELESMSAFMDPSKGGVIEWAYGTVVRGMNGHAYMSKPQGYEDIIEGEGPGEEPDGGGDTDAFEGLSILEAFESEGFSFPQQPWFTDYIAADTERYVMIVDERADKTNVEVFVFDEYETMVTSAMLSIYLTDDAAALSGHDSVEGTLSYSVQEVSAKDALSGIMDQVQAWRAAGLKVYIGNVYTEIG